MVDLTKYFTVDRLIERLTHLQNMGYGNLPVVMGGPVTTTAYMLHSSNAPDVTEWADLFGVTNILGAANRKDGQLAAVLTVDPWTTSTTTQTPVI
jgi:putative AlgH/UPF0301 family transcriptional regulator